MLTCVSLVLRFDSERLLAVRVRASLRHDGSRARWDAVGALEALVEDLLDVEADVDAHCDCNRQYEQEAAEEGVRSLHLGWSMGGMLVGEMSNCARVWSMKSSVESSMEWSIPTMPVYVVVELRRCVLCIETGTDARGGMLCIGMRFGQTNESGLGRTQKPATAQQPSVTVAMGIRRGDL